GVELERFRPGAPRPPEAPLRAVSVGRPSLDKGTGRLVEAWRQAVPPEAELLIVGPLGDGHGRRVLAEAPPNVRHLGVLDHGRLAALLAEADLFILASPIEGGPMAVLEALACGLPCLRAEGTRSVVRDGIEGRIVASCDTAA